MLSFGGPRCPCKEMRDSGQSPLCLASSDSVMVCGFLVMVEDVRNFFMASCAQLWHPPHRQHSLDGWGFAGCLQGPVCSEELQMLSLCLCIRYIFSLGWIIFPLCSSKMVCLCSWILCVLHWVLALEISKIKKAFKLSLGLPPLKQLSHRGHYHL